MSKTVDKSIINGALTIYSRAVPRRNGKPCHHLPKIYSGLCDECGAIFFSIAGGYQPKFCGRKCSAINNARIRAMRCRSGEIGSNWKGGRMNHNGYVFIFSPDHPRVAHRKRKHKYVYEHILEMEKHLGRYLIKDENVHHKNGIRSDNRIENLELWIRPQLAGQRVNDLVAYAVRISKLYPEQFKKILEGANGI